MNKEYLEDVFPVLNQVDSVFVNPVEKGVPGKQLPIAAEISQQGNVSKTTSYNNNDPHVMREVQQNIQNEESIANSTTTCNDIIAAVAVCSKGLRIGAESSYVDGNHKRD